MLIAMRILMLTLRSAKKRRVGAGVPLLVTVVISVPS
jgi:hypothetical protein